MTREQERFFIHITKEDNIISAFGAKRDEGFFSSDRTISAGEPEKRTPLSDTYSIILKDFDKNMLFYRRMVPIIMSRGPEAWAGNVVSEIELLATENGVLRGDLSSNNRNVYEVPLSHYNTYRMKLAEYRTLDKATEHVPEIMIIGLVSTYDSYLAQLLRCVLRSKPEIVFTSQKSLTFAEIKSFGSIEAAQNSIIDREVESIIRESHHEQFKILSKLFSIKLKEGLSIWPKFIEVCERRNLFTHTGGFASQQYIDNCVANGSTLKGIKAGDRLGVEPRYFREAVECIHEIGIKLCYVLWRKFEKHHSNIVDSAIGDLCAILIKRRSYRVSRSILEFCSEELKKRGGVESTRRMMIINLSTCLKMQKHKEQALDVLDGEDWTASDAKLRLFVAAIRNDKLDLISLMKQIGAQGGISKDEYRELPIFSDLRSDQEFNSMFHEIFDEPLAGEKIESEDQHLQVRHNSDDKQSPEVGQLPNAKDDVEII